METSKTIPVIDLHGSNYQIGRQHGELLKEKIKEFYETAFEVHAENMPIKASKESLNSFCNRNIGFLNKYSPELVEELKGIADGSSLTVEDVVFLNSFLEMEDLRPPELGGRLMSNNLWGCTTFNVMPNAATDHQSYIGQTFDMEKYYSKFNVILRIKPEYGPSILTYTFAGVLGLNGINSQGIGLVINKVVANDAREGVIYPFIIRKALMQERVGDALGAIIFSPRASGVVYQLASEDGVAFCAETSAAYYELLPIGDAMGHTNHYVAPSMRKYETPNWLSHGGSFVRYQMANRKLQEAIGHIDVECLKEITRDHTNYPRCICAHGFEGENEYSSFQTISAVIMEPRKKSMWVCHENPCTNNYVNVSL